MDKREQRKRRQKHQVIDKKMKGKSDQREK